MRGLRAAVAFLTRVPVGSADDDPGRSVPWFPVVGALVGLVVAGLYAGALQLLPALPAAAIAVAAGVLLTGAFHEDGLADTADAHGTYGVSALVLVLVTRVGALSALGGWAALAVLPAAHALARAGSLSMLTAVPVATDEGLGALYAARAGRRRLWMAMAAGLAITLASVGPVLFPVAVLLASFGTAGVTRIGSRRVGGITGDVLGAAEQIAETLVLLMGAAVATHKWVALPWWR